MKGLKEVVELLKIKFQVFTSLRYNVSHTSVTFYQLFPTQTSQLLKFKTSLKITHVCYNRRSCLYNGIRSRQLSFLLLHLKNIGSVALEDHVTFISNNLKHDVPFVELCSRKILEHYKTKGIKIAHDIEYNDGCASQFKSVWPISSLSFCS